jgi:hypothetical protein
LSFDIGHFSFVIWSHAQLNLIEAGLQNQQMANLKSPMKNDLAVGGVEPPTSRL